MQENKSQTQEPEPPKKRKKEKGKSFLDTVREIDAKEAQKEAEAEEKRQALLAEQEKKEKEAYAKKIQQDRIELMRLKQGIITESETIHEEHEEKPKLSFWKKIGNFFYHSKWWLGITVVIGGIFAYVILDYVLKVRPDMIVMVLTEDTYLQSNADKLETFFEAYTDDENGDGKVHVDIYCIPVTDDIGANDYYTGDATKLSSQMMLGDAILVLTDTKANEFIAADDTLQDLEEAFPGHDNIQGNGYYLSGTNFAEQIGDTTNVAEDISLGLRTPIKTYDSLEHMQENYDIAAKVFERIMADLDETAPSADLPPAETEAATEATEQTTTETEES